MTELAEQSSRNTVVEFPANYSKDLGELIETLKETNALLSSLAGSANDTLAFVKKYVPWAIAVASVLWPTVGKIIAALPVAH